MDKLFALLGMGGNVANDLLFKVIADDERGRNTNLFYTLQALLILPLCAAAILAFLLSLQRTAQDRYPGLKFSLAALVVVSGLNIVNKIALISGAETLPLILYRYVVVAAIGAAVLAVRRIRLRPSPRLLKTAGASSLIMAVSLYFIFTALRLGEVSVVIPITQRSFIFTAAIAFLLLKERPSVLKLAGIALVVSSILVLA